VRCKTFLVAAVTISFLAVANAQAAPSVLNSSFEAFTHTAPGGSFPAGATYTNPHNGINLSVTNWTFGASENESFNGLITGHGFGGIAISGIAGAVAAFVEGTGFFEQDVLGFDAAEYTLSFLSQGREGGSFGPNPLKVTLGGTELTFSGSSPLSPPTSGGLTLFTSDPITVTAGANTLRFEGTVPFGSQDLTTYVDRISFATELPGGFSQLFSDSGPGPLANNRTGTVGGEFVTGSQATEITKLGFFDDSMDGFDAEHTVELWDAKTQTVVASVVLEAGTGEELIGEFRYEDLASPVILPADTEYRIMVTTTENDGDPYRDATFTGGFPDLSSLATLDPQFSEYVFGVGRLFLDGTPGVYPPDDPPGFTQGNVSTLFGPVNFIGRTVPAASSAGVPEPTSRLLLVSALAMLGVWSRCRRSVRCAPIGTLCATFAVMLLMSPATFAAHGGSVPAGYTDASSAWAGEGVDSAAALQAFFDDATAAGDKVFVPKMAGDWTIGPMFLNRDNQDILFEDGVVMEGLNGAFPNVGDDLFESTFQTNVTLTGYGATFSMANVDSFSPAPANQFRHGIRLQSVDNFEVKGLTVKSTQGDGIYVDGLSLIGFSQDVVIQDVLIDNAFRNGISVISVQGLLVDNTVIVNTQGTLPKAGIDFEPDVGTQRIVDATVRNTVIVANGNDGILWFVEEGNQARSVSGLIENVTVAGNSRFGFAMDRGALPNFVIKDSLVLDNSSGGLRVVAGAGTQTVENSAFSGNGGGGNFVGAVAPLGIDTLTDDGANGTTMVSVTVNDFVNTDDPTSPQFYALKPGTSTLITQGDSDGSFIGARGVFTGLLGDYNNNGIVDAADYTVWRDGNSPDDSQAGYNLWKANFGNTSGSGSAAATSATAVPEPSTALLLLAGLVSGSLLARRRKDGADR